MSIDVRNATRAFGSFQALRGINLTVPTGEFLALLGPSGSGKTTLLRIIAGLDCADEGSVFIDGQDVTEQARAAATSASCSSTTRSSAT